MKKALLLNIVALFLLPFSISAFYVSPSSLIDAALKTNDPIQCEKIIDKPDSYPPSSYYKKICYTKFASKLHDDSVCNLLQDKHDREDCNISLGPSLSTALQHRTILRFFLGVALLIFACTAKFFFRKKKWLNVVTFASFGATAAIVLHTSGALFWGSYYQIISRAFLISPISGILFILDIPIYYGGKIMLESSISFALNVIVGALLGALYRSKNKIALRSMYIYLVLCIILTLLYYVLLSNFQ